MEQSTNYTLRNSELRSLQSGKDNNNCVVTFVNSMPIQMRSLPFSCPKYTFIHIFSKTHISLQAILLFFPLWVWLCSDLRGGKNWRSPELIIHWRGSSYILYQRDHRGKVQVTGSPIALSHPSPGTLREYGSKEEVSFQSSTLGYEKQTSPW